MIKLRGVILSVSIFILFFGASVLVTAYDASYYHKFQENYAIEGETGKTSEELDSISNDIIEYLKSGKSELMTKHFKENESLHMKDVYFLFKLLRYLMLATFIVVVSLIVITVNKKDAYEIYKIYRNTSFIFLVLMAVLAVVIAFNWDKAFVIFHKVLFNNDLWLMNSNTDLMIQMLPTPFFVGMVQKIFMIWLFSILFIMQILHILGVVTKNRNEAMRRKTQE